MDTQIEARSPATVNPDSLLYRIEAELSRLHERRPHLANRITTAEHILTVQLSVSNGMRPIRIRCRGVNRSYVVRSNSKLRKTYTVNPVDWSCDCQWQARGNRACSHAIACFVLQRSAGSTPRHRAPRAHTGHRHDAPCAARRGISRNRSEHPTATDISADVDVAGGR